MANTPIEGVKTSPQVLFQGPTASDYNVAGVQASKEPQAFKDLYSAIQSGQAKVIQSPTTDEEKSYGVQNYSVLDAKGNAIPGVNFDPNTGTMSIPSSNGSIHVNTSIDANGSLAPISDYGKSVGWTKNSGGGFGDFLGPLIGIGAMAFGIPPIIGEALGFSGAAAAAAGSAVIGGGTAALTGNDVLKGAALGGAGGYAGSVLGDALNNGYNFNGPAATSPTISDLTGSNTLTGLDQYTVGGPTASDLMGGGAGGAGSGGYDPLTNSNDDFLKSIGIRPETTDPFLNSGSPTNNDLAWNSGYFDSATGGTAPYSNEGNNYPTTGSTQGPGGSPINASLTGSNLGVAALGGVGAGGAAAGGGLLSGLTTGNGLVDAALISGGAGLLGNKVTGDAISNSINNTTAAAQQAGSTLKDIYNQQLGFVQPYQQLGQQGVNAITSNLPYLQHQFDATDLQKGLTPNYDFMLQQGQMANQRSANMGGGAIGGNALQGLNKFTQDYAGNAYQNAFNNYQTQRNNIYNSLSGIAGMGQTANQQAIGAGTGYGQQQTALTTGLAAAQAGANVGQAQNTSNLISNLGNNLTLASLLNQKQAVA